MASIIKKYDESIRQDIRDHLNNIKKEFIKTNGQSFIQLSRTNKSLIATAIKKQRMQQEHMSKMWDQVSMFSKSRKNRKSSGTKRSYEPKG